MESRFRVRSRLAALWSRRRGAVDQQEAIEDTPISLIMAAVYEETPLSELVFNEMEMAAATPTLQGSVAFRVGAGPWVCFESDGACSRTAEAPTVDALVSYRDERTFVALMDDELASAAAVAIGRLRVKGSLAAASASEQLFVAAEERLRARYGSNATLASLKQAADARRAVEAAEAAAAAARLEAAAARSPAERALLRHLGTDQQLGAALLTLGSALYSGYCYLALQVDAPTDVLPNSLYLASSLLWLLGSAFLIHSSYPERVLHVASLAASDAADASRLRAMDWWERSVGASSLLLGGWGLGLGAPTFLAGAVAQSAAHPGAVVPLLYEFAGVYLFVATGLLVLGALPANLAANDGQGSTAVQTALGGGPLLETHAANDLLAGTLFFSAFMVACLAFGLVDLLVEPSTLTACFAASQLPFAAGALLLARGAYPDMLNRASFWGEAGDEAVLDEARLRGLM